MRRTWVGLLVAGLTALACTAGQAAPPPSPLPTPDVVTPTLSLRDVPLLPDHPLLPDLPPPLGPSPSPSPSPKPSGQPAPASKPAAAPQDRWALIVGITAYRGNVQDTRGGANDARLVKDVLLRNGWREDRIRVLVDDAATGAAIAEGLSWLQRNSSSRTFSFFHYSGHVKQTGGREHLWPVDNRYLVDTEVARVLRAVAGTAWSNFSGCEASGFDEALSGPRHLVTSSSYVTEKSYEDPGTGYSVWTGMLFDEALRRGAGDADGNGRVTIDEAIAYAAPRAHAYTRNQRPHGPQTPQYAGRSPQRLDAPLI